VKIIVIMALSGERSWVLQRASGQPSNHQPHPVKQS